MLATNATKKVISRGSAHRAIQAAAEVIVVDAVIEIVDLVVVDVISASSATNLVISHVNAKRIKISAIVAMVVDTLQKTASRVQR